MFCPNCGKSIPDDSVFCPECGKPVQEAMPLTEPSMVGRHVAHQSVSCEDKPGENTATATDATGKRAAFNLENAVLDTSTKIGESASRVVKAGVEKKAHSDKPEKIYNIGIALGAIWIVVGAVFFVTAGFGMEITSFGGDYQTYTYQGIYHLGVLLTGLVRLVSVCLIAFGAFVDCYFIAKKNSYEKAREDVLP